MSEGRLNGWIKLLLVEHASCEHLIDVVHGWDNHGKVWGSMGEK